MAGSNFMADEKKTTYEYHAEVMNVPAATVDIHAVNERLNQLGADGWKLVCFTQTVAWFIR